MSIDGLNKLNVLFAAIESKKIQAKGKKNNLSQSSFLQIISDFFEKNKNTILDIINNDEKKTKLINKSLKYINSSIIFAENEKSCIVQIFRKTVLSCKDQLFSIQCGDGKIIFLEKSSFEEVSNFLSDVKNNFKIDRERTTITLLKSNFSSAVMALLIKLLDKRKRKSIKKIVDDASEGELNLLFNFLKLAAKENNYRAQYLMALCSQEGIGVEKNLANAIKLYEKIAQEGDVEAQSNLGVALHDIKATKLAQMWFERAAKQGDPVGQYNLASYLYQGTGGILDPQKAFELFEEAAKQGHPGAKYCVAAILIEESDRREDHVKAIKLLEESANQGYDTALNYLGTCFQEGKCVTKNLVSAFKLYEQAAKNGDVDAQYNLGICFQEGKGVTKNLFSAFKWYKEAAKQGHALAQHNLGICELAMRQGDACTEKSSDSIIAEHSKQIKAKSNRKEDVPSNSRPSNSNSRIESRDNYIKKEPTPTLLTSPAIKTNEESVREVKTEKPSILTEEQKKSWDEAFKSLQEKYTDLTICWNEQDCILSFSQDGKWLLKNNAKKATTREVIPNTKMKEKFLSRMKFYLNDEGITSTLLPNKKEAASLKIKIPCFGNQALEWKDFNNNFFDSIQNLLPVNQNLPASEAKEKLPEITMFQKKKKSNNNDEIKIDESCKSQTIDGGKIIALISNIAQILHDEEGWLKIKCIRIKDHKFIIPYAIDGRFSINTPKGFTNIVNFFKCIATTLNKHVKRDDFVKIVGINHFYKLIFNFNHYSLEALQKEIGALQKLFQDQITKVQGGVILSPLSVEDDSQFLKKFASKTEEKANPKNAQALQLVGSNTLASPFIFVNTAHEDNFKFHLAALADNPGSVLSENQVIHYLSYLLHLTRLFDLLSHNFHDESSRVVFKNLRDAIRHSHFDYQTIYKMLNPFVMACIQGDTKKLELEIKNISIELGESKKQKFQSKDDIWDRQIKELKKISGKVDGLLEIKRQDALLFCCSINGKFKNKEHNHRVLYRDLGHRGFSTFYQDLREKLWKLV